MRESDTKDKKDSAARAGIKHPLFIILVALVSVLAGGFFVHLFYRSRLASLQEDHRRELVQVKNKFSDKRAEFVEKELEKDKLLTRIHETEKINEHLKERISRLEKNQARRIEKSEERLQEARQLQMRLLRPKKPHSSIKPLLAHKQLFQESFSDWFEMWEKILPRFTLDVFIRHSRGEMKDIFRPLVKDDEISPFLKKMMEHCIRSPDGTRCVTPYLCWGEVDSCVVLIDLENKTSRTVTVCGTPCSFENAAWLDNNRFAVAGTYDLNSVKSELRWFAEIAIYNISKDALIRYHGPGVSSSRFKKYHRKFLEEKRKELGMKF